MSNNIEPNSGNAEAVAALAAQFGLTPEEMLVKLGSPDAPTVAEHIKRYLALQTKNTRRGYKTHLAWFRDGIGPTCDQDCEPCMDAGIRFECRCDCTGCLSSRISLAPQGPNPVSAYSCSRDHVEIVSIAAFRVARKRGIVENRKRAAQNKSMKNAPGFGAQEMAITALRSLFNAASQWLPRNAAQDVPKPRRACGERRALRDFELMELCHVTETGGRDPELHALLVEYGLATGARRLGAYKLTVGQLHPGRQMIILKDKYGIPRDAPVSAELLAALLSHAIERGGPECDPTSPTYQPDRRVFYARGRGQASEFAPLTARHFDSLHERWQKELPWAGEEQVAYHHLRHTMAERLKAAYGQHVAQRYLRHADGDVTDGYGRCTTEELARALSEFLGFEHPLVHGIEQRRRDSLDRYGYGT